jgi:hypothetical protein
MTSTSSTPNTNMAIMRAASVPVAIHPASANATSMPGAPRDADHGFVLWMVRRAAEIIDVWITAPASLWSRS